MNDNEPDSALASSGDVSGRLAVFDRFGKSVNFGALTPDEKGGFSAARYLVQEVAQDATGLKLGSLPATPHVSMINPSGRTTNHYWCCLYPSIVPHKSYGLQVAVIVSVRGVELCCCLGGAATEAKDEVERAEFQAEWRFLKQRLAAVGADVKERLAAELGGHWFFKSQWRLEPNVPEFSSLEEWLAYAAKPETVGASISRYWTRNEVPEKVDELKKLFRGAIDLFGPLFDAIYLNRGEFEVAPAGGAGHASAVSARSWIFQANPKIYDIDGAIRQLKEVNWRVAQHKERIRKGHRVYVWRSGPEAAIIAIAVVLIDPAVLPEPEEQRAFDRGGEESELHQLRVTLRVERLVEPPLTKDELRRQSGLENLLILRMTQGTNFPITAEESHLIEDLIDNRPPPGALKRQEFRELFMAFAKEFLNTPAGQKHLHAYDTARTEARQSFEQITGARARGEDITDLVLAKILPHNDTETNRKRGAWIHIAPALGGDVRTKFNAKGLTTADAWPAISTDLFNFLERCLRRPEELGVACADLSSRKTSKGFASGMLSPFLNGNDPDHFAIFNGKSRPVVNYLAGIDLGHSIKEYPIANESVHKVVADFAPLMHEFPVPTARDGDLFDMFCHYLVGIKKIEFGKRPKQEPEETDDSERNIESGTRYWKIAPGEDAENWPACRGGFIALGWSAFGDVSDIDRAAFENLRDRLAKEYEWTSQGANQVWTFANKIMVGDRIVANHGKSEVLGIGTVTGPYSFVKGNKYAHRLTVRWDDLRPRHVIQAGWQRTIVELDADTFQEIVDAELVDSIQPPPNPELPPEPHPEYPLAQMAAETGHSVELLERWVRSINRKGQAILYGPPGTGKTFVAERLALHLLGGGTGATELVQFHPAYSYEDFIQGIRPQTGASGSLQYPTMPGRFLEFCKTAAQRQGISVLIIDEINRANLARVFGELMYLLEYRDREVPLAGGGKLRIPANVRLIGTMNTADRSTALVDHALRRRFAFLPLYPDFELLSNYHKANGFNPAGLVHVLKRLNNRIGDRHYEVGISFFLRKDLIDHLADIWRMEIEPYVEEYFAGEEEKAAPFGWDTIKDEVLSP